MYTLPRILLSVLIVTLFTGCAADSTLRGSWGTWQMKGGAGNPCSPVIDPETRTPTERKGFAPAPPVVAPVRPVEPVEPVEPLSVAPTAPSPSATPCARPAPVQRRARCAPVPAPCFPPVLPLAACVPPGCSGIG